jgi:hypothetical protein
MCLLGTSKDLFSLFNFKSVQFDGLSFASFGSLILRLSALRPLLSLKMDSRGRIALTSNGVRPLPKTPTTPTGMTINPRTTPRGRREKLIKNPPASLSAATKGRKATKLDKQTVKRNTKADDKKKTLQQPKAERPTREVVKNTDPSSKFTSKR